MNCSSTLALILIVLFIAAKHVFMLQHIGLPKPKALSDSAIFVAACNAILLLGDVKLANTCFHHSLPIYFQHTKHLSPIYIS